MSYRFVRSQSRQSQSFLSSYEKGAALVETSIVLPLLIGAVMGVTELGRALNEYYLLTRIAYEGARLGAVTPGLTPGAPVSTPCVSDDDSSQSEIPKRIERILESHSLDLSNECQVTVHVLQSDPGINIVKVRLETKFTSPLFSSFLSINSLSTEVSAPYLMAQE